MRYATHLGFIVLALAAAGAANAKPTGPTRFCAVYPESSTCAGRGTTCTVCHTSTSPEAPAWNLLRLTTSSLLSPTTSTSPVSSKTRSTRSRPMTTTATASPTSKRSSSGTLPGDANSFFVPPNPGRGDANPSYDVGNWDPAFAMRRMMVAFCGRSPTFDEMQQLAGAADPVDFVHNKLDQCLASAFWTGDGLARLADERVKPIDLGTSFLWDYRLWRFTLSGDCDVRDLLLADYHVREPSPGNLVQVQNVVDDGNSCTTNDDCASDSHCDTNACIFNDGGQPLVQSERAGMIGTQWFHFINTMFSAMPRTTAAQAMRAYLGMDIARQQGIDPIPNEPLDVDNRGVQQEECAQCHATLDPATYVFAKYKGIEPGGSSLFDPNRPIARGLWTANTEPQGMLLGQQVSTLKEWGAGGGVVGGVSDEPGAHVLRVRPGQTTGPAGEGRVRRALADVAHAGGGLQREQLLA